MPYFYARVSKAGMPTRSRLDKSYGSKVVSHLTVSNVFSLQGHLLGFDTAERLSLLGIRAERLVCYELVIAFYP